jgi:prevent-host-death family protein
LVTHDYLPTRQPHDTPGSPWIKGPDEQCCGAVDIDIDVTKNMVMKKVNIYEAKAKLSEFVDAVELGERVVICRRNQPVAELVRAVPGRRVARPVGTARGALHVPSAFFDPLPRDVLDSFSPGDSASAALVPMVADRPAGVARRPRQARARKGRRT